MHSSVTPSNLKNGLGMPKALRKLPAMVKGSMSFVLKLHGHCVPGLESVQASILW